ncbi:serpin family protein [Labedaea rhizosphaerae]|uniref:Serpin B n=1 Tax=Labedaea rhizosphaerae TaxID=598644 RepID=A0A4R6SA26_LABRH|nr:serpin family protein [Labedaea rhizosphaerae]TDP96237.1 serpin B [Labedaea rhizosphaerae]
MTDEHAHLNFCLRLHRALAADPDTTSCWSPFSVASALSLLTAGASGETRDELSAALADGDHADLVELLEEAGELAPVGERDDPPQLAVANTLWADASISVREEFVTELAARRGGGVREAPFHEDPAKARRLINNDVAETTNGLIPELIPSGALRADTVSALVNALYLKVAWRFRFSEQATTDRPFRSPAGRIEVPTMQLTESLDYAHLGGWQAVGLPALGDVQAVVLLPDSRLADAEPALTGARLAVILGALGRQRIALSMPKFRLSMRADLVRALTELGVRKVFTDDAELDGITSSRLAVHAVLHEAVLNVDEQGIEGAAATAVLMRTVAAMISRPVTVQVDRPFLLLVRHQESGAVYFMARVTEP